VVAPYANAYDGVLLAPLVFVALASWTAAHRPVDRGHRGRRAVVVALRRLAGQWGSQSATAIVPIGAVVGTACIALLTRVVTPRALRISEGDRVPGLAQSSQDLTS
jgi:hypothetical protein